MNVKDFTYLLQHPDKLVSASQTKQLEEVLSEYPYFQAARAVHLKGLKRLNSFKYNDALKVTAAHTTDRDVLFDFITSKDFLQHTIADSIAGKSASLPKTQNTTEAIATKSTDKLLVEGSVDGPLPQTIADANNILDPALFISKDSSASEKIENERTALDIGQPLSFTKQEKYSFSEWLQLTSQTRIDRDTDKVTVPEKEFDNFDLEEAVLKKRKFDLIDKFISENPKIGPADKPAVKIDVIAHETFDKNELMTETLAKVYLEQKKYKKAVQAYKILSLKYPEKSGFFADRIKMVEKIQQENS